MGGVADHYDTSRGKGGDVISDKTKWQLLPVTEIEAHVVCTCGDVSVHISETDDGYFHIANRIKGLWVAADNPLWPDLPSAMVEAERICKGEAT